MKICFIDFLKIINSFQYKLFYYSIDL